MSRERTTRFGNSGEINCESPGRPHLKRRNTAISTLVLLASCLFSTIGASALPSRTLVNADGTGLQQTSAIEGAPADTSASPALPGDGTIFGGFTPQPISSDPGGFLARCIYGCIVCKPFPKCILSSPGQVLFLLWQAAPVIAASPKKISPEIFPDTDPGLVSWAQMRTIPGRVESSAKSSSQQLQIS